MKHREPGDDVELGTCIAFALDPATRWGRLVGIRNTEDNIHKFIIRLYEPEDKKFPTGRYNTTSSFGLVPHTGHGCPDE